MYDVEDFGELLYFVDLHSTMDVLWAVDELQEAPGIE